MYFFQLYLFQKTISNEVTDVMKQLNQKFYLKKVNFKDINHFIRTVLFLLTFIFFAFFYYKIKFNKRNDSL